MAWLNKQEGNIRILKIKYQNNLVWEISSPVSHRTDKLEIINVYCKGHYWENVNVFKMGKKDDWFLV